MPAGPAPPPTQQPPVSGQQTPLGTGPVNLTYDAAVRTRDAVRYVEGMYRHGGPRQRRGSGAGASAGAWAYVAGTITGASGSRLGSGTAVLCSRVVDVLTPDGDTVSVLNAGGGVVGPIYVKLGWTDGAWSLDVAACPPES